ncbi:hypothetical protein JCM8547_002248 [Rhodosporidiobolus lusitaniae]
MDSPVNEIRGVIRELCQPKLNGMLNAVNKYFTPNAQIFYPLFNSPKAAGIEGIKSAYAMLRVLTYGNNFDFHAVAMDRIYVEKGVEYQKGMINHTEHLKLRFPLPDMLNPVSYITLERNPNDNKWYVLKQEDVLTGLHFLPGDVQLVKGIKFLTGAGTLLAGGLAARLNIL